MCQILSRYADDHLFIFCICQKKLPEKKEVYLQCSLLKKKNSSEYVFLWLPPSIWKPSGGHKMDVRRPRHFDFPLSFCRRFAFGAGCGQTRAACLKKRDPVVSMKQICTGVYILFFPSASFLWCHLDILRIDSLGRTGWTTTDGRTRFRANCRITLYKQNIQFGHIVYIYIFTAL